MKIPFSLLIFIASLCANELIHVSNVVSSESLEELSNKYKKDLIVSDGRAYIVPSECLLERHFGGLSQGRVELAAQELQNGYLAITQEVFEAKDEVAIKKEIEKQKISDAIEAKVAKAFLDDADGHLFGGLSQGMVDLGAQKEIVKDAKNETVLQTSKNPTCKLTDDGSGYMLYDIKEAKLYKNSKIEPLINNKILFN